MTKVSYFFLSDGTNSFCSLLWNERQQLKYPVRIYNLSCFINEFIPFTLHYSRFWMLYHIVYVLLLRWGGVSEYVYINDGKWKSTDGLVESTRFSYIQLKWWFSSDCDCIIWIKFICTLTISILEHVM